jgi:hypothetical protein
MSWAFLVLGRSEQWGISKKNLSHFVGVTNARTEGEVRRLRQKRTTGDEHPGILPDHEAVAALK